MNGQWIGAFSGNHSGSILVNIENVDNLFLGNIYLHSNKPNFNPIFVQFLVNELPNISIDGYVNPIDMITFQNCSWSDIHNKGLESFTESTNALIDIVFEKNNLKLDIVLDDEKKFTADISRNEITKTSKIESKQLSWPEFKEHLSKININDLLFRGQQEPWPLRTSFHRRGRLSTSKFINFDVKLSHKRLSAITKHFFNLRDPEQNGSFLNLLQHHGYPTPLLDWSNSPFVAAFFAFRNLPLGYSGDGNVRIYLFNNHLWTKNSRQIVFLDTPFPHFSFIEFIALENPRHVPQQSVTTLTNVDDVESYIQDAEKKLGLPMLFAIDIPANEREVVMHELKTMGITAGSMFPGIDGVCEELRESNFTN